MRLHGSYTAVQKTDSLNLVFACDQGSTHHARRARPRATAEFRLGILEYGEEGARSVHFAFTVNPVCRAKRVNSGPQ